MHTHRALAVVVTIVAVSLSACAKTGKTTSAEAAGSVATSAALPGTLAPASQLISSLSSSIPGLSQAQAILGAGSVFGLAKAKMPTDQFSQVAKAVPGAEALVEEATKAGLPAASELTGLSSLTPILSKAGINAGTTSSLVSALGKAVTAGGGQPLGDAFLTAVK